VRGCAFLLASILLAASGAASVPPASPAVEASVPPGAERAYRAISARFDRDGAFEIVSFMDQYWRLAGNPGFNASIDHLVAAAGDRPSAEAIESKVLAAWIKWYQEALDSVLTPPVRGAEAGLRAKVAAAKKALR
jgi:hypothetical protein